jgi:uncharacterized protein (DUF3084 family)
MVSGYLLVLAMLFLGGVIATVGDRIGTRVGKARLSLFNLRPRNTATLVTIMTGTLISAATFGFIFAADNRLGQAIFDYDRVLKRLGTAKTQLNETATQKDQVTADLALAQKDQAAAKKLLGETNQSLQVARAERSRALADRARAEAEITRIQATLTQTEGQLGMVSAQAVRLRSDIGQLQAERSQVSALREQELKARDAVIQQREDQLKGLESQQEFLALAIQRLQQEAKSYQEGNIAIQRNQVLASAVVGRMESGVARQAVDRLLQKANSVALQQIRPGSPDVQIVQITRGDVEQLINRIADGKEYVVRIFAAENYVLGTLNPIQIFTDVVLNRPLLQKGQVIAATTLDPTQIQGDALQERIQLLIAAANFRARSLGVLTDSVQINRVQNFLSFIEQLRALKQPVEVTVTAADITSTAGPLRVNLQAAQNGQVLFGTEG